MRDPGNGTDTIEEFRAFFAFVQDLWGMLAGVSIFFPLSNELMRVIPIGGFYDEPPGSGAFQYFSPELVTSIATLVTLFVVVSTFGRRHRYNVGNFAPVRRQAWLAFGLGIASLALYLTGNFGIYELCYGPYRIWGDDPRRLIGDMFLLSTYSVFFALTTRAFTLLGMAEFFGARNAVD